MGIIERNGMFEVTSQYNSINKHNSIREWCKISIGPEFDLWSHYWTSSSQLGRFASYTWRFTTKEDATIFYLTWM